MTPVLPDAEAADRAMAGFRDVYQAKGSGAGMAAFIAMTSSQGEFTDDYFAQAARPIPPSSGCRARTTAAATTRCSPTGPRRSPAIAPTSTRSRRRRPASSSRWAKRPGNSFTGRTAVATAHC